MILSVEPERLKNREATTRDDPEMETALCRRSSCLLFQMFGVETGSFFQTIKVVEAILRARVRRAIDGFIPFASKAA